MKLRHIEAFAAIMKTGSISAAAKRLHLSQPAVSRILQHAETQLGYALFIRTPTGMTPTERALRLFPHIQRLFVDLSVVQEQAKELRTEPRHTLKLGVIPALGVQAVPQALKRLYETHPHCEVHVQTQHSAAVLQTCALQQIDVGVAFDVPDHPNVASHVLCEAPVVCVAPLGWLPRGGAVGWSALKNRRMIGLSSQDPLGQVLNRAFATDGFLPKNAATVQTYHLALAMVQEGLGLTLIDAVSAAAADPSKVEVRALEAELSIAIKALRAERASSPALSELFITQLAEVLRSTIHSVVHQHPS
jgi:DNA-binding transcriptional LysR family regulator